MGPPRPGRRLCPRSGGEEGWVGTPVGWWLGCVRSARARDTADPSPSGGATGTVHVERARQSAGLGRARPFLCSTACKPGD